MILAEFIRQEVECQGFNVGTPDGDLRVAWMLNAMHYALDNRLVQVDERDILTLARYVEPARNRRGYRQTPVFIYEGWKPTVDWRTVPEAMRALVEGGENLTPIEFYTEFELIHPFNDGNGRVGAILYNWLSGTLGEPEVPTFEVVANRWSPEEEDRWSEIQAQMQKDPHVIPWAGVPVFGPEERRAAMNYPIQGADEEEDDDDVIYGAAEKDIDEGCCQPWWEPCCTKDGEPL